MQDIFKIVQLTDSHLLADEQALFHDMNVNESFLKCLSLAETLKPDLLLLTGDVAEDGEIKSYERVKNYLEATHIQYIVIPGNHDQVSNLKQVFKEACLLDQKYSLENGWNLLLLNSVVEGEIHGALSAEGKKLLQQSLKDDAKPSAVFLHHHPVFLGSTLMDQYALQNPQELWNILSSYEAVKLVCSGHVHQQFEKDINGIPFLATPATSLQIKPGITTLEFDNLPSGLRYFELNSDSTFSSQVVRVAA